MFTMQDAVTFICGGALGWTFAEVVKLRRKVVRLEEELKEKKEVEASTYRSIDSDPKEFHRIVAVTADEARSFCGVGKSTRVDDGGPIQTFKPGTHVWLVYKEKN